MEEETYNSPSIQDHLDFFKLEFGVWGEEG